MASFSGSFASGYQYGFADHLPRDQRIGRGGRLMSRKVAPDARYEPALAGEA